VERGVILGSVGKEEQLEVWELIKDKQVSTPALEEIIANCLNPVAGQMSLLNLYVDRDDELVRLELIAQVRTKLKLSKKLLHLVSNQGNATFLESIGNNLITLATHQLVS
jgi:hypothetical protein